MQIETSTFKAQILEGIPDVIPAKRPYDPDVNHAPKRKAILNAEEKKLALKNALRYFDKKHQITYILIMATMCLCYVSYTLC